MVYSVKNVISCLNNQGGREMGQIAARMTDTRNMETRWDQVADTDLRLLSDS
jgi:hypothetical protein